MAGKLLPFPSPARPIGAGRAMLLRACAASGLTQAEQGALVGIEARSVRKLLRRDRKRVDRLDLLVALEQRGKKAA